MNDAENPVDQVLSIWANLDARRRMTVVIATLGMFAAVYFLTQLASQPRMALLYAGLDAASAGEVVTALEERGAIVDVRGSAIYVNAAERDALRLALAGDGLPQNGGQGYELLDTLTGFGTTAQMFDAAYWRAKEGELARTITANRQFAAARVHISNPAASPFQQGNVDSASVSVTMASGSMTPAQATALRFLVASAVTGLSAQNVSVIDSANGLMPNDEDPASQASSASTARADALRASVTRLLEARVGKNKAIVEVSVEPVTEREEITERRFEPDSRVPISSNSEETTTSSSDRGGQGVTVASNLPDGEAGDTGGSSQSTETRTREIVNYEVSETQRAIIRTPGSVRRITVAALVDGILVPDENGTATWQPRAQAELEDLRELIASAVGFNTDRGDQITIRSMQFEPPPAFEEPEPLSFLDRISLDVMGLIQMAVLALVSLVLGLFVLRPILTKQPNSAPAQLAPPPAQVPPPVAEPAGDALPELPALDGEIDGVGDFAPLGELPSYDSIQGGADPAARLRELIEQKQDETVEVLSQWMNDPQEASR
ncbi:MAG: flagellar basal-body MS-ring/collar protein FliF [Pseudomonadota bacterium]